MFDDIPGAQQEGEMMEEMTEDQAEAERNRLAQEAEPKEEDLSLMSNSPLKYHSERRVPFGPKVKPCVHPPPKMQENRLMLNMKAGGPLYTLFSNDTNCHLWITGDDSFRPVWKFPYRIMSSDAAPCDWQRSL